MLHKKIKNTLYNKISIFWNKKLKEVGPKLAFNKYFVCICHTIYLRSKVLKQHEKFVELNNISSFYLYIP